MNPTQKIPAKYVFGPIASRRLGRSLGVDLVPAKYCSLNCVYCEAGVTTCQTLERQEYVPLDAVIAELHQVLDAPDVPPIDFITFSGAGEPTLNSRLGDVVDFLKRFYPQYKLCLITNSTLLGDPALQREIARVDVVIPSFDASSDAELAQINRPAPGVSVEKMADDLEQFCKQCHSQIFLELFVVPGVNDSEASIRRFQEYLKRFRVTKLQLNTLDRPGCVTWIKPAAEADIQRMISAFEPIVPVEAVGKFQYRSPQLRQTHNADEIDQQILAYVSRRGATIEDLMLALNHPKEAIQTRLTLLKNANMIRSEQGARGEFFLA